MARYIDAEPLEKEQYKDYNRVQGTYWQTGYWAGIDEMCEKIKETPTADVVEVVHGEWEVCGEDLNGEVTYKCSNCGKELVTLYGFEIDWNYCPECGAKMDGKKVE